MKPQDVFNTFDPCHETEFELRPAEFVVSITSNSSVLLGISLCGHHTGRGGWRIRDLPRTIRSNRRVVDPWRDATASIRATATQMMTIVAAASGASFSWTVIQNMLSVGSDDGAMEASVNGSSD